jgi:anti-sigma regulatory factor (Ser/Thr protein kinase)
VSDTVRQDVGTQERFAHEAVFYDGPAHHADAVLPFIRDGVTADEPVLVALLPDVTAEVRDRLGSDSRWVTFVDMADLGANPARIIPAWRQFLAARRQEGPVRGVGEPIWPGRRPAEMAEAVLHEGLLNVAFDDGPAWRLLCPYDARGLPADVLAEARRTHPSVSGVPTGSIQYDGHGHPQHLFATELPAPPGEATRIDFGAEDLSTLRAVVRRLVAAARLDHDAGDDLVLAAHELAMNSVQHGGGRGTLLTWQDPDALVVEVRDTGTIEDPLIGRTMPDFGGVSGRGIWMANQLCSLVQVRSGRDGTQVRLHTWL